MSTKIQSIQFHVIAQYTSPPSHARGWSAYLNRDKWDDKGKFCTQFHLTIVDETDEQHGIGAVKIGQRELKPHDDLKVLPVGHRVPDIPVTFDQLGDDFFSVGQDEEYYSNLSKLGDKVREFVLSCLRDVAWDKDRWEWAKDEEVTNVSLLRYITSTTVNGQFRRMAHGDSRVTPYHFNYSPPKQIVEGAPPFTLDFNVDPESTIPTNVHVIIGRNGVGKTRLLLLMAKALVSEDASARQSGNFRFELHEDQSGAFANVVAVSFSAFDDVDLLPERNPSPNSLGYSFIGLRDPVKDPQRTSIEPKSPNKLATEFVNSLQECCIGARRKRWEGAINTLQTDPVFRAAQLTTIIKKDLYDDKRRDEVKKTFKALGAGHKIVLLTLTRLVEKVEEKTLVLIDEPEAHLHPPLLSAMTRAISELMVKRNGVTIIATHSPVILQEVPRSCVWILDRLPTTSKAYRPPIETFAENVGILSREVFQLELSQSGYHQILRDLLRRQGNYENVISKYEGQLGSEGRAILRGMSLYDAE